MRSALAALGCALLLLGASSADEPKRKAIPIGDWNLSGESLEKAQMDGKRVVQMHSKGDAKLRKGRNPLMGPWTIEASSPFIEADFPGKRFILHGPYVYTETLGGNVKKEIRGNAADSTLEVPFLGGIVTANGPNHVRVADVAPAPAKKPRAARPEK